MLTFSFAYTHNMYMKKFWINLSEIKKMLILASLIGIVLALFSLIGLFFNEIGWLIGVLAGTIAELVFLVIQYKSTDLILKGNKAGLYILLFIARMAVVVALGIVLVLFEFKFPQPFLKHSIFGYLIGIFPISIITILGTKKSLEEGK